MRCTQSLFSSWRQHAFTLALIACMIRALIPAGFMPDYTAPGHMTICSGIEGQASVPFDPTHKPAAQAHENSCPFAVNTAGLADTRILLPAPAVDTLPAPSAQGVDLISAFARSYSSRAPPFALTA